MSNAAPGGETMTPETRGIYVASRTRHGAMWRELRAEGIPVCASWIDESDAGQTEDWADLWDRCIAEATHAAAVILYIEADDMPLKGAFVEVGAALAHRVPVFYVGKTGLFSFERHRLVTHCASISVAIRTILSRGLLASRSSTPTRTATDATLTDLLAELRHNAEEWGAGNGNAWLDRLTESEEKIERYVARLSSSPSSTTATPAATCDCYTLRIRLNDLRSEQREIAALFGIEPCHDDTPHSWSVGDTGDVSLLALMRDVAARFSALPSSRALSAEDAQFLADRIEAWARSWPARDDDVTRARTIVDRLTGAPK